MKTKTLCLSILLLSVPLIVIVKANKEQINYNKSSYIAMQKCIALSAMQGVFHDIHGRYAENIEELYEAVSVFTSDVRAGIPNIEAEDGNYKYSTSTSKDGNSFIVVAQAVKDIPQEKGMYMVQVAYVNRNSGKNYIASTRTSNKGDWCLDNININDEIENKMEYFETTELENLIRFRRKTHSGEIRGVPGTHNLIDNSNR